MIRMYPIPPADSLALLKQHIELCVIGVGSAFLGAIVSGVYGHITGRQQQAGYVFLAISLTGLAAGLWIDWQKPNSPQAVAALERSDAWWKSGGGKAYPAREDANVEYVTTTPLRLRSGASLEHQVLAVLPKGSRVLVRRFSMNRGDWIFVETLDRAFQGYVDSHYLVTVPRGERRTISTRGFTRLLWANVRALATTMGMLSVIVGAAASVITSLMAKARRNAQPVQVLSILFFVLASTPVLVMGASDSLFPGWWIGEFMAAMVVELAVGSVVATLAAAFVG